MSIAQYCLSWNSYKSNVCDGFAHLQQNGEFVDMTLAAEGHLVNVHRNLIALASPYLKEMLQSTPSHYPVIFLSNISHEVLCYILEYIYTGEVCVGVDKVKSFMKAATDLHLVGIANSNVSKDFPAKVKSNTVNITKPAVITGDEFININVAENITSEEPVELNNTGADVLKPITNVDYKIQIAGNEAMPPDTQHTTLSDVDKRNEKPYTVGGIQYRLDIQNTDADTNTPAYTVSLIDHGTDTSNPSVGNFNTNNDFNLNGSKNITPFSNQNIHVNSNLLTTPVISKMDANVLTSSVPSNMLTPNDLTPQYTMSTRGSLQLILNRYMYYSHHQSFGGRKRRWRCVDYRKSHCPAFIDTDLEIITTRKFIHSHPFHDNKIIKKMKKNLIFTSLNRVIEQVKKINSKNPPTNTEAKIDDESDNI